MLSRNLEGLISPVFKDFLRTGLIPFGATCLKGYSFRFGIPEFFIPGLVLAMDLHWPCVFWFSLGCHQPTISFIVFLFIL